MNGIIGHPIDPIVFPKVNKMFPTISIHDIVAVQPMTKQQ
jgi:hypothetical protein